MARRTRRGDFLVPEDDLDRAEAIFAQRSERSREVDKAARAPVTGDIGRYERLEGRGVDYPGVDTPTADPFFGVGDLPGVGELDAALTAGEGFGVDPLNRDAPPVGEDVAMFDLLLGEK